MKNFYLFAIISILLLYFASCSQKNYNKELKTIDSLYLVIDTIENYLKSVDTMQISDTYEDYMNNISLIRIYFNDKKDDTTWSTITTYGIFKKPFKNFIKNYSGLYKEIKFSHKQLDSLKFDIKENNISKEKISIYINDEAEAITNLKQQTNIQVNSIKSKLKLYDSINPKVIQIIERLKKKKK